VTRYRDGARTVAPIAVVVAAFGASFGVLAGSAGIETAPATVMSATTFAGSARFAAASILGTSGGIAAAVLTAAISTAAVRMLV
jgi:predicted branched-subunit amino acid permease